MTNLKWYKSSYSQPKESCIEVAENPNIIHVRDSKDTEIPGFSIPGQSWEAFVSYAKQQRI